MIQRHIFATGAFLPGDFALISWLNDWILGIDALVDVINTWLKLSVPTHARLVYNCQVSCLILSSRRALQAGFPNISKETRGGYARRRLVKPY